MDQTGGRPGSRRAKKGAIGDMSSPVRRDKNQPASTETSAEVESGVGVQSPSLRRISSVTQRVPAVPVAHESGADADGLVARALEVLEREQQRWRAIRSQDDLRRGERS
jgi:hypothetical protein